MKRALIELEKQLDDTTFEETYHSAIVLAEVLRSHIGAATTPNIANDADRVKNATHTHTRSLLPFALSYFDEKKPRVRDTASVKRAVIGIRTIHGEAFNNLFVDVLGTSDLGLTETEEKEQDSKFQGFANDRMGYTRKRVAKKVAKATAKMLENDINLLAQASGSVDTPTPRVQHLGQTIIKIIEATPVLGVMIPGSASLAREVIKKDTIE